MNWKSLATALLASGMVIFSLTACGADGSATTPGEVSSAPVETQPVSAPTPEPEQSEEPAGVDDHWEQVQLATMGELYHRPLDELPKELRDSLKLVKEEDMSGLYNADWGFYRTYEAPGLQIKTSAATAEYLKLREEWYEERYKDDRDQYPTEEDFLADMEGEENREWILSVTVTQAGHTTENGLEVGMTVEEAQELGYTLHEGETSVGREMERRLAVFVEDGVVVQMDAWWQMGRMVGKFFEL